jgi:hypothetical protein
VRAVLDGGAQVVERGLAGARIQRDRLEHHVGRARGEPRAHVRAFDAGGSRRGGSERGSRESLEAGAARAPAEPARCDPGDDALDAMVPRQRLAPASEQRMQRLVDGAEAKEGDANDASRHGAGASYQAGAHRTAARTTPLQ